MKNQINKKLLDAVQSNLNENLLTDNIYSFKFKDRRVKVIFSDNPNAPTIESALVKIVTRRIV